MRWPSHSDFCYAISRFLPKIPVVSFVFAAFVACCSFSAQAQNLISDPLFSSPAYASATHWGSTAPYTSYTVSGWTFSSSATGTSVPAIFDGSGSTKTPLGGGNSVQLTISDNTQNVVAATATLTTALVAGQTYTLTFEEYSHSSQHSGIDVFVGGVFSNNTLVGSTAASTSGFLTNTITFTVTTAEVAAGGQLSFELFQPSAGGQGLNAAFGNVSLTSTPEPNSVLGLAILSVGLVCTVERRRTKNAFLSLKNRLLSRARSPIPS